MTLGCLLIVTKNNHYDFFEDILSRYSEENIDTDWKPVRTELYSEKYGYLEGGWYEFEKDLFGNVVFEGKIIPCISVKGQKIFHSGYDLRDKDKHDIVILENRSE